MILTKLARGILTMLSLFVLVAVASAQTKTITGKVTDQKGEAVPFHACDAKSISMLNQEKMTNEIPLVNIAQQSVRYGTDAIIAIIGKKHPTLAKIASWRAFQPFIKTLYSFISYNSRDVRTSEDCRSSESNVCLVTKEYHA